MLIQSLAQLVAEFFLLSAAFPTLAIRDSTEGSAHSSPRGSQCAAANSVRLRKPRDRDANVPLGRTADAIGAANRQVRFAPIAVA